MDNDHLLNQLKKGDEKAFTFLVEHYNHALCVYANSLINDSAMAQDIVQNVFIKTWEKRDHLRRRFSIKNFLYKSVYNEFIDQYRKRNAVTVLEKKYIDALDFVIEQKDTDAPQRLVTLVMNAIQDLPPKCKQTFLLSKKEGLTNFEISEYLEVSPKTVEAQLTKGFSIIRKKLNYKI